MLGSELQHRALKLEREQKQRLEKEKLRADKEKLLDDIAKRRRQQREEEASRRRAAAIAATELERLQHEEEVATNNGVWWSESLAAVPISERTAAERGIKRGADKVSLPPSVGNQLTAQDASKNGALFFQLTSLGGLRTHAGLLDFNAAEGTIGIPPAVAASLWPEHPLLQREPVTVTYRRLEKGTFVRLQPEAAGFQKEAGDALEDVLVAALSVRSAISEGDWLSVDFAGQEFRLRVQQLRPVRQVSVIDTEMEAEVEPSIETEERLRREAAEAGRRQQELIRAEAAMEADRLARAQAALAEAAQRERVRQEKAASLPAEASPDEPSTLCMIRFPDGSRHTRRLRHSDPISHLFHFVDAQGGGGHPPGGYNLVTQFPRHVIEAASHKSMAEAGLNGKQEALMLEPTNREAA